MNVLDFFYNSEFRSLKRKLPVLMIRCLILMTVIYGFFLTFTLPWNLLQGILATGPWPILGVYGNVIFASFLIFTMFRWCIVHPAALWGFSRNLSTKPTKSTVQPFVSILVPACNEASTMDAAIRSMIALDYPQFEIIVIDDGSTDATYGIAKAHKGDYGHCTVRAYSKPNGGKWSALNFGFAQSKGELLLCVDADSRLSSDTLWLMIARIQEDSEIVGVAGQVTIRNRINLLTKMQALEYVLGNGGMRMALSQFGVVTIVPGAIGLYRRAIFEKIERLPCNRRLVKDHGAPRGKFYGPFSSETFAEDFQLSLSALALGGKVVYEPRAVAFTKGPDRVHTLISQRYRWMRGTWQVLRIYVRDLRKHAVQKNRLLDWVVVACYTIDIFFIPIVNFGFWTWLAVAGAFGVDLTGVLLWIMAIGLLNFMTATIYLLVQDDDIIMAPLSFVMDIYLSLLINSAWVIAAIDELRGTSMKWH